MSPLEKELESALLDLYEKWKSVGRPKNYFLMMVKPTKARHRYKGPVGTVRYLLGKQDLTDGFKSLVRAGKRDWTVESLVLQPKWKSLFNEQELEAARSRIEAARSN